MSYNTCLECGAEGPVLPGRDLPLEAHGKDCPYRHGWRWECSCAGPYCDEGCDGRLVPPEAPAQGTP